MTVEDVPLLGAPLFPGHVLDAEWSRRCADLSRAMERLESIESQGALIMLRASFGSPKVKVQHLLRCYPSLNHPALQTFDALLRSGARSADYQLRPLGDSVHSGKPANQRWWSGNQTSVFARTFCLFSFSGKHSLSPEPYTGKESCV